MATINGMIGTSSVSSHINHIISCTNKVLLKCLDIFLQLFNSLVRTVYIVVALDSIGYMWTFVIFACIAAAGMKYVIQRDLIQFQDTLSRSGGSSVLFYPEEITSEYFRETLELKHADVENHAEESKEDAVSDIDDGYYSRK